MSIPGLYLHSKKPSFPCATDRRRRVDSANTNMNPANHRRTALRAPLLLLVALAAYLHIAGVQYDVNNGGGDQDNNLSFAIESYNTRFQYTGERNRMPLYPWIQALFYSPEMTEEEFFEQGKRLNIIISLVSVAVFAVIFRLRFSKLYAVYALAVIAFLLFALKAPYFQPEILYYTWIALAFVLSIEAMREPSWYKSLGVGVLFALAHFTKASALPGLALYTLSFSIPMLWRLLDRSLNRREFLRLLAHAICPVIVFAVLLFPYFNESKERYGQYLYNVNTTFYMWYDSWAEAKAGTKAAGDRIGWPDLPDDQIPSLGKYLAEHSAQDIANKIWNGLSGFVDWSCTRPTSRYVFGNCPISALA